MKKKRICPICGEEYNEAPAISRRDNKTEICSYCGQVEAFEDMQKILGGKYGYKELDVSKA